MAVGNINKKKPLYLQFMDFIPAYIQGNCWKRITDCRQRRLSERDGGSRRYEDMWTQDVTNGPMHPMVSIASKFIKILFYCHLRSMHLISML